MLDFDSCAVEGCPLPAKKGLTLDNARIAKVSIDGLALKCPAKARR